MRKQQFIEELIESIALIIGGLCFYSELRYNISNKNQGITAIIANPFSIFATLLVTLGIIKIIITLFKINLSEEQILKVQDKTDKVVKLLPIIAVSGFWFSFFIMAVYFIITKITGGTKILLLVIFTIIWISSYAIIWKSFKKN